MNTNAYLWQRLAEFFLGWEMFQNNIVEEISIHFTFNNYFLHHAVYEIMWKILYSRASHGWQCIAFHALCILDN